MIILNYNKDGHPVSDFDLIPLVKRTLISHTETNKADMQLDISNLDAINLFECAIRDGLLDVKDFKLIVGGLEIRLNDKGEELDNYISPFDEYVEIYVLGNKLKL